MGYFQNPCRGNESKQQACPYDSQYYKCGCDKDVYKYDANTCPDNSTPGSNKCGELSDSCICSGKSEWSPDLNICEPRCSSNNDCGETQKCDPETRTCVNKTCNDISSLLRRYATQQLSNVFPILIYALPIIRVPNATAKSRFRPANKRSAPEEAVINAAPKPVMILIAGIIRFATAPHYYALTKPVV